MRSLEVNCHYLKMISGYFKLAFKSHSAHSSTFGEKLHFEKRASLTKVMDIIRAFDFSFR